MNEYGPFENADVNLYSKKARALIKDINSRNKIAIVEGGSLFYLKSLFEGKVNRYHD
jgi:tRNA A37 N6-isopentenylltransferase MiaA